MTQTKFLLDSGDPDEYRKTASLLKKHGEELWGATTNPSLIAKKLTGKKITSQEAFDLQKKIVLEILTIVPGAVSAEVYADEKTTAEEMIEQGRVIAAWDKRMYVKLPTTVEGFKARTKLRESGISINNTLVFNLRQIFAINLHEKIMQENFKTNNLWPSFISPFVGRLDDKGLDGMKLIEQAVQMKQHYNFLPWILESSVRSAAHIKRGTDIGADIMTIPAKLLEEWFAMTKDERLRVDAKSYAANLKIMQDWTPSQDLVQITTIEHFYDAIESGQLDVSDELTTAGIDRFANDWKAIIEE